MTLIAMIIVTGCTIAGSLLWRKRRIVSLMLFIPLLTVLLTVLVFGGYIMYQSWYHTTPDSLQLSVRKEHEMYVVEGSWKDPLDAYRFPSDFLVFYVPNNEKITNVKRQRFKDYKEMDSTFIQEQVIDWIEEKPCLKWKPQIFDLQTDKQFQFSFVLPDNVKPSDVKLYYVHTREEPMDSLEFWFKNIELK